MPTLLAFPVLVLLVMLQTVVASNLILLHGSADLVMLVLIAWALHGRVRTAWIWAFVGGLLVSFVSAMPLFTPLIGYLLVIGIARLLQQRMWQSPILAMFVTTVVGTLLYQVLSMVVLIFSGTPLPLRESLSLVILPSTLLNLLLSLPVYVLVSDMVSWVYPAEVEA